MNMKNKFLITTYASLALIIGGSLSYSAYADTVPKAVKLAQLKNDFEREKAKFEAMPQSTSAEDSAKIEAQGRKVKQLGWEAGELEAEINPPDPKKELEANIRSLKGVLAEASYFRTKVDDPIRGDMYKKGVTIVEQKKIDIAEIEKDLEENKIPLVDLIQRFEKVRDTKVLE